MMFFSGMMKLVIIAILSNGECLLFYHNSDMKEVETKVRSICTDGLLWGACEYTLK